MLRRKCWILYSVIFASISVALIIWLNKKEITLIEVHKHATLESVACNVLKPWKHSKLAIIPSYKDDNVDFQAEMDKLNDEKVVADDPRLVKLIRNYYIQLPSELPYNLEFPDRIDTSLGQAPFVDSRLGYKEEGFYVESGAHDGDYLSNTLFFERMRNWNGILIEPLPEVFQQLQNKHRKAYNLNACLSLKPYPSKEYLTNVPVLGKIVSAGSNQQDKTVSVQCFPLYSILLAMNRTTVDFLSLDVEGVEPYVLETIPWNKVNIKMMAVEYDKWPGGHEALCRYMEQKGYDCLMQMSAHGAADVIFSKKE